MSLNKGSAHMSARAGNYSSSRRGVDVSWDCQLYGPGPLTSGCSCSAWHNAPPGWPDVPAVINLSHNSELQEEWNGSASQANSPFSQMSPVATRNCRQKVRFHGHPQGRYTEQSVHTVALIHSLSGRRKKWIRQTRILLIPGCPMRGTGLDSMGVRIARDLA